MSEQNEKDIAELLSRSGVRAEPPASMRERVYQQTLNAFEQLPEESPASVSNQTSPSRQNYWYALAAGLVLTLGALLGWQLGVDLEEPTASIAFATGGYSVDPHGDGSNELKIGTTLSTAQSGHLLVVLDEHTSIRLDEQSQITLQSGQRIFLHRGQLYVDSDGGASDVQVVTADVAISKVGTQFAVSLDDKGLTIAVREGKVMVASAQGSERASASSGMGDVLRYTPQGRRATRDAVATTDQQYWQWTQLSRPEFDLATHNLFEYLQWAARERGQHFVPDNSVVAQMLKQESIDYMRAADASDADLEKVLSVTYFIQVKNGPAHELRIGQR